MTRALAEATSADLSWWAAYADLEPFGPLQESRRAGVVALSALAPWSKRGEQLKLADLFPELRDSRPRSNEETVAAFAAWAAAFEGR